MCHTATHTSLQPNYRYHNYLHVFFSILLHLPSLIFPFQTGKMYIRDMADKQYILSILKSAKPQLEEKYGLKEIALFGSYSRGTHLNNTSDVDVMVEFNRPIGIAFIDLADELETLLQLKVDLVSRGGIKPKYFKAIEPDLIYV